MVSFILSFDNSLTPLISIKSINVKSHMKFGFSCPGPDSCFYFLFKKFPNHSLFKPRGGQIQIPFYKFAFTIYILDWTTLVFCMYHLSNSRSFIHLSLEKILLHSFTMTLSTLSFLFFFTLP